MYMEALTVLIRQESHIRITRLLRPIFLIDTYYMVGVRRYGHYRYFGVGVGKYEYLLSSLGRDKHG